MNLIINGMVVASKDLNIDRNLAPGTMFHTSEGSHGHPPLESRENLRGLSEAKLPA